MPKSLATLALAALLSAFVPLAHGVELTIAFDVDEDAATGCAFSSAAGTFEGAELLVVTEASNEVEPPQVQRVYSRACVDATSDSFGAEQTLDPGSWPVGLNLGPAGEDVVESGFAAQLLGGRATVRAGFVSSASDGGADLAGTALGSTVVVAPSAIPLLSLPALAGALVLTAGLGLVALRRRRGMALVLVVVVFAGGIGVAWAAVLDGQIGEWSGIEPLVSDGRGETGSAGADLTAVYSQRQGAMLYFRFDLVELEVQGPAVVADSYALLEDGGHSEAAPGVLGNDTADSGSLSALLESGPAHAASFSLNADGSFDYVAQADYYGGDSFQYRARDALGDSAPVTVSLEVAPVNDAPSFSAGDPPAVAEDAGAQSVAGWASFAPGAANEAGQTASYQVSAITTPGLFSAAPVVAADGTLSYTPAPNAHGSSQFTVTVQDDGGTADGGQDTSAPQSFTITVTSGNDAPVANAQSASTDEDTPVALTLTGSDVDVDNLTFSILSGPSHGSLGSLGNLTTTSADVTYTPDANYHGADSFTFQVQDPGGLTASTTVSLTVDAVNDPPSAVADGYEFIGNTVLHVDRVAGGSPSLVVTTTGGTGLLENDSDPVEGSALSVVGLVGSADASAPFSGSSANGGSVELYADGSFSYLPAAGDLAASDSFQYKVSDGGATVSAVVTLTRATESIWYVKNDAGAGGLGRSTDPFDTLAEAETAAAAGDIIFVHAGDGSSSGQDAGITLDDGQRLWGEGVALSITGTLNGVGGPHLLWGAGSPPLIANAGGSAVGVDATAGARTGIEVRGVELRGATAVRLDLTDHDLTARISDNRITSDSSVDGIFASPNGSGALDLTLADNTFSGVFSDRGIEVVTGGGFTGAASLAVTGQTGVQASQYGIYLHDSTASDRVLVTAFGGHGIRPGGLGAIALIDVVFDADPGTGGIQTVSGSGVTIERDMVLSVPFAGLTFSGTSGALSLAQLDIDAYQHAVVAGTPADFALTVTGTSTLNAYDHVLVLENSAGSFTFDRLDIDLVGAGKAIDLRGSSVFLDSGVTTIDGAGPGSGIGIDMSGATNPHGANATTPNLRLAADSGESITIAGVDTGVLMDTSATTSGPYLVFGDQVGGSSIDVNPGGTTLDTTGLSSSDGYTEGRYEFLGVGFGSGDAASFEQSDLYYVAASPSGAGDGSSPANAADATRLLLDAAGLGGRTIVLIDDGNPIALGANTLTLAGGTDLAGFGNGATPRAFTVPANVIVTEANLASQPTVSDPTGNGAATLSANAGNDLVALTDSHRITDIALSGGDALISGTGVSGLTVNGATLGGATTAVFELANPSGTIDLTGNTINQSGGYLLDLTGGTSALTLSGGSIANSDGAGLRVRATTGGSVTVDGAAITSANATPLTFDDNDASFSLTQLTVSTDAAVTLLEVDANAASSSDLVFDASNTLSHTSGPLAEIGAGSRSIDLGAHDFTSAAIRRIVVTGQSGGSIAFGAFASSGIDGVTAVSLAGSGGTVSFRDLDIATTSGDALDVGAITLSLDPAASPTLSANLGTALRLNGTTFTGTIDSLTGNGGTRAVDVAGLTGALTLTTVDIDDTTAEGILIDGGGSLTVNGGTIDGTQSSGISAVDATVALADLTLGATSANQLNGIVVSNATSQSVAIDRVAVAGTAGWGFFVSGASGGTTTVTSFSGNSVGSGTGAVIFDTVDFDADGSGGAVAGGTTVLGSVGTPISGKGLSLQGVSGSLSFADLDIVNAGGTGIEVNGSGGFSFATADGTVSTSGATALDLANAALTANLASIESANATGRGVYLNNVTGSLSVAGGTITGSGGNAFDVAGGSATVNYGGTITNTAGRLLLVVDTAGGAVTLGTTTAGALSDSGSGIYLQDARGDVTIGGSGATGTVTNLTGSDGLRIYASAADLGAPTYQVNGLFVNAVSSGNPGVLLDGTGSGYLGATLDFNDLDITNPDGAVLYATGVSGSLDFDAASTFSRTDSNGGGIRLLGNSGNLSLAGAATLYTGSYPGLDLQFNTGASIAFAGTLEIFTTSGAGLSAIGGGTLTATGSGSSVVTSGGTGINIDGTTIGAGGVTFQSVSVDGATNGIVLNTTGSEGTFSVTGDASTGVGTSANNDSGGVIQNATGNGIVLSDASGISLDQMRITGASGHGISATRVSGLTLARMNLVNNGDANQEHGIYLLDPHGTIAIGNLLADGNFDAHIRVLKQAGAELTSLSVDDSVLQNVTTGQFEDGILFELSTATTGSFAVTNSSFSNHDGDHIQATSNGSAAMGVTISGNTMSGSVGNLGAGITVNMAGSFSGNTTFDISSNDIQKANGGSTSINVNIGTSTASGTATGRITDNTIGTPGNAYTAGDTGISTQVNNAAAMTVEIANNSIYEFDNNGIVVSSVDGTGTVNATLTGNTVSSADSNVFAALFVDAQTDNVICADVGGGSGLENSFAASAGFADVGLRTGGTSGSIALESYAGTANDQGQISTYLQGRNAGTPSLLFSIGGGGIAGGGACPTP